MDIDIVGSGGDITVFATPREAYFVRSENGCRAVQFSFTEEELAEIDHNWDVVVASTVKAVKLFGFPPGEKKEVPKIESGRLVLTGVTLEKEEIPDEDNIFVIVSEAERTVLLLKSEKDYFVRARAERDFGPKEWGDVAKYILVGGML